VISRQKKGKCQDAPRLTNHRRPVAISALLETISFAELSSASVVANSKKVKKRFRSERREIHQHS
jgi:hypothetical protein